MYQLNVEKRDMKIKVKKLRRDGLIPCSILNGITADTIHVQVPEVDLRKLLKSKGRGGKALLICDNSEYEVIIKDISYLHVNDQLETVTFQNLVKNVYINSFARVNLLNRDKIQKAVYMAVKEIPYRALPGDLIEEVDIDLAQLRDHSVVYLKDLPIWNNKSLQIPMLGDRAIIHIA